MNFVWNMILLSIFNLLMFVSGLSWYQNSYTYFVLSVLFLLYWIYTGIVINKLMRIACSDRIVENMK